MDYIRFHRLAVKPKADMESILFLSSFRFLLQAMGALFPEQGKAATGLLPWPLQLTTYENQLDPLILKSSLLLFRGMQPITHMNIRHRPGKSTPFWNAP